MLRSNSRTFIDNLEVDFSMNAVHVWGVLHQTAVGTIKGWIHLLESDGSIFSRDISWPHCMIFEAPNIWRVCRILVEKHLPNTHSTENYKEGSNYLNSTSQKFGDAKRVQTVDWYCSQKCECFSVRHTHTHKT